MNMSLFLTVLLVLVAIFLCIIIPGLLFLRQIAMKRDIESLLDKVSVAIREYATFCGESQALNKKVTDVQAELHAAKTRDISTQETITKLSNKINSRVRAERKLAAELEDREEEEQDEIEGTEQTIMNFPVPPQPQQVNAGETPDSRIRRFGEMP